jgi:hypothetical protein
VPSLGITNDTFTGTESKSSDPPPTDKSRGSIAFSKAGVDTGSIAIRGGTHFEYSYLPSRAFRATLRGIDLAAFYTNAWFDKYVKGDPSADARLLSTRWRNDPGDLAVDPAGGGNLYSFYYRSRLDIGLANGGRFLCEDLRSGCPGQAADDGLAKNYSFLSIATATDGDRGSARTAGRPRLALRASYRGAGCSRNRTMVLKLKGADAPALIGVTVRHRGKLAARGVRGATIRLRKLKRSGNLTLTATLRDGRTRVFTRHLTLCSKRR